MKLVRWSIVLSLCMICLFTINVEAKQRDGYGEPVAVYKGEKGPTIISFSENWNSSDRLQEIYNELLLNFHYKELAYLENIYIYPDSPEGVAGYYFHEFTHDEKGRYVYKDNAYIEVFDADEYTQIEQMAKILSHEYGHHFTTYYLMQGENRLFSEWKLTEYSHIRDIVDHPRVKFYDGQSRKYEHKWDIMEIAAEDYVQLFASPTTKNSTNYYDVEERARDNIKEQYYYTDSFNLLPQENMELPLAADVKGLYLYWLKLVGFTATPIHPPAKPKIELVEAKEVIEGAYQYRLAWNEIKANMPYEYTVIVYPVGDSSFPRAIKTLESGEPMYVTMGVAVENKSNGMTSLVPSEYQYGGMYTFQLLIKSPRGFMFATQPIVIELPRHNLELRTKHRTQEFKDLTKKHWAYETIHQLVAKKMIRGYSDHTFKPTKTITRAEFMTMVVRMFPDIKLISHPDESHWFKKGGYEEALINLSLITEAEYGEGFKNLKLDEPISREEMGLIVGRYINMMSQNQVADSKSEFKDYEQIRYKKQVDIAVRFNIISGYPDKSFRPKKSANRAEAAAIIGKLIKSELILK